MTEQDRSAGSTSHTAQTLTQAQGDTQKDEVSPSHHCISAKQQGLNYK